MHRIPTNESRPAEAAAVPPTKTSTVLLLSACMFLGLSLILTFAARPLVGTSWSAFLIVAVASASLTVFAMATLRGGAPRSPPAPLPLGSGVDAAPVRVGTPWRSRSFLALAGAALAAPLHTTLRAPQERGPRPVAEVPQAKSNGAWFRLLMDKDADWIPGVNEAEASRLEQAGYGKVRELAEAEPDEVAAATGIEEWRVQEFRSFLAFVAVPGLERRSAWLLVRAGVADLDQFCHADPTALAETLDDLDLRLNGADRLFRYSPLVVERWQIVACEVLGREPPYVRGRSASESSTVAGPIVSRGTMNARA